FELRCFSEFEITNMRLYCEIMGKYSNAVLVKDGTILGALKTASLETGARRVMMSGAKYSLPEKQDKCDPTDLAALQKTFENKSGDAAKFIADNVAGVAFTTACDAVETYGENITAEQLYGYLTAEDYSPCVVLRDGAVCDFKARFVYGALKRKTLLEAQAEYYGNAVKKKKFDDKKRRLLSAVNSAAKKVEKRLAAAHDKLAECAETKHIKLKGELITANIYAVERGVSKFEAVNYYDENRGKITIELDPRLTPSQNAQRYFKRYAKLKRTAQNINGQIAESEAKLSYLNSIAHSLNSAEDLNDFTETEEELIALSILPPPPAQKGKKGKTARAETPFRKYEKDGFTILCGRNNAQNDRLTKSLNQNDLWLHVKT
ncbi:MAG: NFACT family protein, partial [Clostridia bacterium]|nr:NFACT family protein [Clostridia bacterium]